MARLWSFLDHRHDVFVLSCVQQVHGEAVPELIFRRHILLVKHAWLIAHSVVGPVIFIVAKYVLQDAIDNLSTLPLSFFCLQIRLLGKLWHIEWKQLVSC